MRKGLGICFVAFVFMCLSHFPAAAVNNRVTADTILFNGKIVTVDQKFSILKAVAIKDGKFVAVGEVGEVMRFSGPKTVKIDLRGKTVIPGLMDSHIHMSMTASQITFAQLKDVRTIGDLVAVIKAKAGIAKPGDWIQTGFGWHESQLAEQRLPTRWELDAVAPNNPVYIPRGGHVAVVNSMALNLAGITKETPDPAGGKYVRDANGELTGVMYDNAKKPFNALLPVMTYAQKLQGLKDTVKMYNRYGITSVIDPLVTLGSEELKAYFQLWGERGLTVRTGILIMPKSLSDVTNNPYWQGFGDNVLRIAGLKLLIDGGVESALMSQPYKIVPGEQENQNYYGVQTMPTATHLAMLQEAAKNGWHFETHAVGDKGIDTVVDNYVKVIQQTPAIKDKRWTVMHCQVPTQSALDKMKANGIWINIQNHPTFLGQNMKRYWGMDRAAPSAPTRTLLDRGFVVGGGTDGPIVPIDPFLSLWWFVTRNTVTAGLLGPEQRITREEALRAYTIGSAHFTFEEGIKGSIEAGKLADLVILDRDILTCAENEIKDVRPLKTMVGGKFVYEAKSPQGGTPFAVAQQGKK